jgi:hypothetical protein
VDLDASAQHAAVGELGLELVEAGASVESYK